MAVNTSGRLDKFAGQSKMEVEMCAACGVLFAAPEQLLDERRDDGKSFYCPNGHSLTFGNGRERLERELEQARARAGRLAAARDQAEAGLRVQKGRATRFKNDRDRDRKRVAAGVCPCCNRTFQNLASHMKSQHPQFAETSEQ